MASICGKSGIWLKAEVLKAGHISAAFVTLKVLRETEQGLWTLVQGSISDNLDRLGAKTEVPADPGLKKVWQLLRIGYSRQELQRGLRLLLDISWSTTSVEQQHGSAAQIMKLHPQYGRDTMTARSLILAARSLFSMSPQEKEISPLKIKMERLQNKGPSWSHITGRQVFVSDLIGLAKAWRAAGRGDVPQDVAKRIFRRHGARWQALSDQQKDRYNERAAALREEKRQEFADSLQEAQMQLELQEDRTSQEEQSMGKRIVLSSCGFTEEEKGAMQRLFDGKEFTKQSLGQLRKKSLIAPPPPTDMHRALMEQQVLEVESNPQGPRPDWLPTVCAHRELFEDCALIFVGEDGELHSFKFVYASQSPHMACFSEIARDSPDAEPADVTDIHNWQQTSGQRWARRYKIDLLKIFEDHQLPAMEEERMAVLPLLIFLSEWLVVSDAEPLPWNRFIEGLPPARKSAPPAERSAGATSPHMQADLVAQYPWLAQLAQPSTTRSAASSTQTTAAMDTSDHPTEGTEAPSQGDQSLLDEAWADLYRARQELHQDDEAEPTDFRYTMLGGLGL